MEIGSLCVKTAGRDAGKKCVVVDILEKNFVLVDGEARRRKCNILHLEPLGQKLGIKAKASHDEIVKQFKGIGIELVEPKKKEKTARPKKVRKVKEKKEAPKAAAKKAEKPKAEKKLAAPAAAKPQKKEAAK